MLVGVFDVAYEIYLSICHFTSVHVKRVEMCQ